MSEMKEPPDHSWIKMETIRDGGGSAYTVAMFGVALLMALASIALLLT